MDPTRHHASPLAALALLLAPFAMAAGPPPTVAGVERSALFVLGEDERIEDAGRFVVPGGRFARREDFEVVRTAEGGRRITSIITAADGSYRAEGRWDYAPDDRATAVEGRTTYGGKPVVITMRIDQPDPLITVTVDGVKAEHRASCPDGCLADLSPSALPMFTMARRYDAGRGGEQPFRWIGQSLLMDQVLLEGTATISRIGEGTFDGIRGPERVVQYAFVENLRDEASGKFMKVAFNLYTTTDHRPVAFAVGTSTVGERAGYEGITETLPPRIPETR